MTRAEEMEELERCPTCMETADTSPVHAHWRCDPCLYSIANLSSYEALPIPYKDLGFDEES